MATSSIPAVFVSSTCFDLAELRVSLRSFIDGLGFESVLSEFNSFPVAPSAHTVEACLNNVRERADIFVLIIGRRYGSITDSGHSVTNLEFIQARAKNIPIYVFVEKALFTMIPIWKEPPDAKSPVDSTALFEFVENIRGSGHHWVYSFEHASDITETLKRQWAYLFLEGLKIQQKLQSNKISERLSRLTGRALRLVLERPMFWEHLLFAEVVNCEFSACKDKERDKQFGISIEPHLTIDDHDVVPWVSKRLATLNAITKSAMLVLNEALPVALGPPGSPGDAEAIVYSAERFADRYRALLTWDCETRHALAGEGFERILTLTARAADLVITEIERFVRRIKEEFELLEANPPKPGEGRELNLMCTLDMPPGWNEEFSAELARLRSGL